MAHTVDPPARPGSGEGARRPVPFRLVPKRAAQAPRPVSILLLEPMAADAAAVAAALADIAGYDVTLVRADGLHAALGFLAEGRFDLVLCNFWLGEETSVPFIAEAREGPPIVLYSDLDNEDIPLIGRRAGAAGFLARADLTPEALGAVLATLLGNAPGREAGRGSIADWLRSLLKTIDRVHAASALAQAGRERRPAGEERGFVADIVEDSADLRYEILEKLSGLEAATLAAPRPARIDVVPVIADAVRRSADGAPEAGARVAFSPPSMPIHVEADPSALLDLVQGLVAEGMDDRSAVAELRPSIRAGDLVLELVPGETPPEMPERTLPRIIAEARRAVVAKLAEKLGGSFEVEAGAGRIARLTVPLRPPAGV